MIKCFLDVSPPTPPLEMLLVAFCNLEVLQSKTLFIAIGSISVFTKLEHSMAVCWPCKGGGLKMLVHPKFCIVMHHCYANIYKVCQ